VGLPYLRLQRRGGPRPAPVKLGFLRLQLAVAPLTGGRGQTLYGVLVSGIFNRDELENACQHVRNAYAKHVAPVTCMSADPGNLNTVTVFTDYQAVYIPV